MSQQNNIGFVFENLGPAQTVYTCLQSISKWYNENINPSIVIFYQENCIPCVPVKTARFHIKDAGLFNGHLISTSFKTLLWTKDIARAKQYLYINDLEQLRSWCDISSTEIDSILRDTNIIKFCRAFDHKKYLEKLGYKVHDIVVPNFEIDKILEIINA